MKKNLLILLGAGLLFSSCYYDIEEELYPDTSGPCDVSNITYGTTVVPILGAYGCLGCHGGSAPSGNINLASYTGVKAAATSGKLYGTISHSAGYSPMPQGGNKMNSCDIQKIKAWVDAGSPNN